MNTEKIDDRLFQTGIVEVTPDEQLVIYKGKKSGILVGLEPSFAEQVEEKGVIQVYDMNLQFEEDFDDTRRSIIHSYLSTKFMEVFFIVSINLHTTYESVFKATKAYIDAFGQNPDRNKISAFLEIYRKVNFDAQEIRVVETQYSGAIDSNGFEPEYAIVVLNKEFLLKSKPNLIKSMSDNGAYLCEVLRGFDVEFFDYDSSKINYVEERMDSPFLRLHKDGTMHIVSVAKDDSSCEWESTEL